MNQYFKRPVHQLIVVMPLQETNALNKFDVKCHVKGGGLSGQAGAIIHGISRALIKSDATFKKTLKKINLLLEIREKLKEKNTDIKKHVEVSNSLRIILPLLLKLKVI